MSNTHNTADERPDEHDERCHGPHATGHRPHRPQDEDTPLRSDLARGRTLRGDAGGALRVGRMLSSASIAPLNRALASARSRQASVGWVVAALLRVSDRTGLNLQMTLLTLDS